MFSRAGAAGVYLQEIAVDIYLRDQGFMVPEERETERRPRIDECFLYCAHEKSDFSRD